MNLLSAVQEPSEEPEEEDTEHRYAHVSYELRVYSLRRVDFSCLLASANAKAPSCLTSVQFSPSSAHVVVAYGRLHDSLLCDIATPTGANLQAHGMLEVYDTVTLTRQYVRTPRTSPARSLDQTARRTTLAISPQLRGLVLTWGPD